jgi:hypothetical protein
MTVALVVLLAAVSFWAGYKHAKHPNYFRERFARILAKVKQ